MSDDLKISVIRKEDLNPGDLVVIYYPRDKKPPYKPEMLFKEYGVKVVSCPDDYRIEVKGPTKFREFL